MTTLDVKKHVIPEEGESPTWRWTLNLSKSIRDFIPVADTTARAQLITDLTAAGIGPSSSNPVVVFRADATTGQQIEYTVNGSAWVVVDHRSASAAVSLAGGITGSATVYRQAGFIWLEAAVAGTFTAGAVTTIGTIPSGWRPSVIRPVDVKWSNGEYNWGNATTGGTISAVKTTAGASTVYLSAFWNG